MILITQILLGVLFFAFVLYTFMAGFRYGVDVTVNVYIDEQINQDSQSRVRHEYINERRAVVKSKRDAYQDWRRRYNLPDTSDTRALYDDADYRAKLEEQESQ